MKTTELTIRVYQDDPTDLAKFRVVIIDWVKNADPVTINVTTDQDGTATDAIRAALDTAQN